MKTVNFVVNITAQVPDNFDISHGVEAFASPKTFDESCEITSWETVDFLTEVEEDEE